MAFPNIPQRTDDEMMQLILSVAQKDERIRAVIMNGSRANPNAPRDRYQDFDIVYFVKDIAPFVEDPNWLSVFGERVIMQTPEDWEIFLPYDNPWHGHHFNYLMQFMDGNRIDLTIAQPEMVKELTSDSETILLLDKDGIIPSLPDASDKDYWVKKPDENRFYGACNEFLWVSTYVAKGLARGEVTYARTCMEEYVRDALLTLLGYYAGIRTDFSVSIGKSGKYLPKHLPPDLWEKYLDTFPDIRIENTWRALFTMMELFGEIVTETAESLGYPFPEEDYRRVLWYLEKVKKQSEKEIS